MKRRHLLAAAASSFVAVPGIVSAQAGAWPSRGPIKLVMLVGFTLMLLQALSALIRDMATLRGVHI